MLRFFCTMGWKWCRKQLGFLQNAGGSSLCCKRNGAPGPCGGRLDNKLRNHGTFARCGQTEKETKKWEEIWKNPPEIRLKIANCMNCPKGGQNKRTQKAM